MRKLLAIICLIGAATSFFSSEIWAEAPFREKLVDGFHYPRVVRLAHGPVETHGMLVASTNGVIFQSVDDGTTWKKISVVPNPTDSPFRCCSALYELPRNVGDLAAGTLLSSATVRIGSTFEIDLYKSSDGGRSWTYVGIPVVGGRTGGGGKRGVWEPEFTIGRGGALILLWSDETDPCCSQKLSQMRTYDGITWRDRKDTLTSRVQDDRPGMVGVSLLPGGQYFMTYEMCGPSAGCAVFYRLSSDGWNYGDPTWLGIKATTATGQFLVHAPTNAWTPVANSPNGAVLIVGQMMREANGQTSSLNGATVLISRSLGAAGSWDSIAAPVMVPGARGNQPCTNYSSALLPSVDGSMLLELASEGTKKHCSTYFASAPTKIRP